MNITDARGEKCHQCSSFLPEKIYLPTLHIKLGLMKNSVKLAVDSNM